MLGGCASEGVASGPPASNAECLSVQPERSARLLKAGLQMRALSAKNEKTEALWSPSEAFVCLLESKTTLAFRAALESLRSRSFVQSQANGQSNSSGLTSLGVSLFGPKNQEAFATKGVSSRSKRGWKERGAVLRLLRWLSFLERPLHFSLLKAAFEFLKANWKECISGESACTPNLARAFLRESAATLLVLQKQVQWTVGGSKTMPATKLLNLFDDFLKFIVDAPFAFEKADPSALVALMDCCLSRMEVPELPHSEQMEATAAPTLFEAAWQALLRHRECEDKESGSVTLRDKTLDAPSALQLVQLMQKTLGKVDSSSQLRQMLSDKFIIAAGCVSNGKKEDPFPGKIQNDPNLRFLVERLLALKERAVEKAEVASENERGLSTSARRQGLSDEILEQLRRPLCFRLPQDEASLRPSSFRAYFVSQCEEKGVNPDEALAFRCQSQKPTREEGSPKKSLSGRPPHWLPHVPADKNFGNLLPRFS